MADTARRSSITEFIDAGDVAHALKVSRSTAYEHLRRAAGRPPGSRGLLRVPVRVWERYVKEVFEWPSSGSAARSIRPSTTTPPASGGGRPPTSPTLAPLTLLPGGSSAKPTIPTMRQRKTRPRSVTPSKP